MSDKQVSSAESGTVAVIALLLLPFTYAIQGWSIAMPWRWFVPRVWPSAPLLTPSLAIGLATLFQLARGPRRKSAYDGLRGSEFLGAFIGREIFAPLTGLLIAYLAYRVGSVA